MKHPTRIGIASPYGPPGEVWIDEDGHPAADPSVAFWLEPDEDGPLGTIDMTNGPLVLAALFVYMKGSSSEQVTLLAGEDPGTYDDLLPWL